MNCKITVFALSEPWYTLVNALLKLSIDDDDEEFGFLFNNSFWLLLLLFKLGSITGPHNHCQDIHLRPLVFMIKTIYQC